jgi:hypothetical protein
LEVLITYSLSVEIVSMFRQGSLVAGLRNYFYYWTWEYGSLVKHLPTFLGH